MSESQICWRSAGILTPSSTQQYRPFQMVALPYLHIPLSGSLLITSCCDSSLSPQCLALVFSRSGVVTRFPLNHLCIFGKAAVQLPIHIMGPVVMMLDMAVDSRSLKCVFRARTLGVGADDAAVDVTGCARVYDCVIPKIPVILG